MPFDGRNSWLLIDIYRAARRLGGLQRTVRGSGDSFEEMQRSENAAFSQGFQSHADWILVDVLEARKTRPQYKSPSGRAAPAIHSYLPAFPDFRCYKSREKSLEDLRAIVGPDQPGKVVVLQGEPGFGKSMLAHQLALAADAGCGWFLNAADRKALTRSLAQAEREENSPRNQPEDPGELSDRPDPGDDGVRAASALDRLREAERPWVVVLDNCDLSPDEASLGGLMPEPRGAGQFVIVTTTCPKWLAEADARSWEARQVRPLEKSDLEQMGLPAGVRAAAQGRPLIAEALGSLQDRAIELPDDSSADGARLVWDLIRESSHLTDRDVQLARLLAWGPPEPLSVPKLLAAAGHTDAAGAGASLAGFSFVTLSSTARSSGPASLSVLMHRMFAAAVREQTWGEDPAAAADTISRLLTTPEGRECFTFAAETDALARLEPGSSDNAAGTSDEAVRAASEPGIEAGLLWYGLGHIRERRGPVKLSASHFEKAVDDLDDARYPYEVAESLMGIARPRFQNKSSSNDQLTEARANVDRARRLLEPLDFKGARQLREQGNALAWLITQVITARESDDAKRKAELEQVRAQLLRSYLERLRIEGDLASTPEVARAPEPDDHLGSERAYYNLAGVNIQLAKTNHALATRDRTRPPDEGLLAEAAAALDQTAQVYEAVRRLRELRYEGRPHPHLASCIQGQATVAYFRAVLLGEVGQLADAMRFAAAAMEQRMKVAAGLAEPGSPQVLADSDVGKSLDFILKVAAAGTFARHPTSAEGKAAAAGTFDEAATEWLDLPEIR
jgi:hypothetical protein